MNPGEPQDPYAEQPGYGSQPTYGQQPYGEQPFVPPTYGQPTYPPPGYAPPPPGYAAPLPYAPQPYGLPPGFAAPPGYVPPPGYYQYGAPAVAGTNGMAIASMVLGILWIYWIGSILALIFGYVARNQLRSRPQSGGGMAIAGIILGWVGIAALVITIVVAVAVTNDSNSYGLLLR